MDFDPTEGYVFPQKVTATKTSDQLRQEVSSFSPPQGLAALWYLGNATFLLKSSQGTLLAIDPYLSDYCARKRGLEPTPKSRLLPVFLEPEDLDARVLLFTHSHCDHTDPLTLERLRNPAERIFVAPFQSVACLREAGVPDYAIQLIHPGQTLVINDLTITATFAEPTDDQELNPVGYSVQAADGPSVYFTGDTAWSERIGAGLRARPDVMCVCINGGYRNLSHWQAAELAARIKPAVAVPDHFDLMPHNLQPPHMFRKSLWENTKGAVAYCRMDYAHPYVFGPTSLLQRAVP